MERGARALEDLAVNASFWQGRNVLVTGHTGFKGAWLTLWLESMGANVIGFSLDPPSSPSLYDLAAVGEVSRSVEGDVRDADAVRRAVDDHRPEVVFHMAAQSLVRRSFREPVETYATNVMGTVNLLDAVRHSDAVRVVVNVTTDKCYENHEWEWGYREYEPMGGHDPYSSSKGASELVTSAFRRSFFGAPDAARIASARAGNVIGGGDFAEDRLIPDVMRAAESGEPALIRNPDAVRPWQHVLNPLGGYLLLAERLWDSPEHADAWNFGPADAEARPVRWVLDRLSESSGGAVQWREDAGEHPHEATYLKLDSSKARTRLGWTPRWDLERGLDATAEWYEAQRAGEPLRERTLEQIRAYSSENAGEPVS